MAARAVSPVKLFQLCALVTDPVSRSVTALSRETIDGARQMIDALFDRMMGSALVGQGALATLPSAIEAPAGGGSSEVHKGGRLGFVGLSLDAEFGNRFITQPPIAPGQADRRSSASPAGLDDLLQYMLRHRSQSPAEGL